MSVIDNLIVTFPSIVLPSLVGYGQKVISVIECPTLMSDTSPAILAQRYNHCIDPT
jgi:hypothetical protein